MVMRLMIRLSVAKIPFGMVPADDMSLDTDILSVVDMSKKK